MSTTTTVKAGDTTNVDWTTNANLTGATVVGYAKPRTGATVTLTATIVSPGASGSTIRHALTGALAVGTYSLEFEITDTNGKIGTTPTNGYHKLVVLADLGDAV